MPRTLARAGKDQGEIGDYSDAELAGFAREDHTHEYEDSPISLPLLNGFASVGAYEAPRAWKVGNLVVLQGVFNGPDVAAGTPFLQVFGYLLPSVLPLRFPALCRQSPPQTATVVPVELNSAGFMYNLWDLTVIAFESICDIRWLAR